MHRIRNLGFQELFNAMPCHVVVVGSELEVIHANDLVRREFGDPTGLRCFELLKGQTGPCASCPAPETFADGRQRQFESSTVTADGRELMLLVSLRPIADAHGKTVALLEISTDVTELKTLHRALEQEHEKRRDDLRTTKQLFDEVPCYVSVMDEEFTILETNREFKEALGDVPGAKCHELFKRRPRPCAECPVAQTFHDGLPHSSEATIRSLAGHEISVAVRSAPIKGSDGRVLRVMELAVDVTAIKELQHDLARLGKMAAHAAHNIKGILTGLKGGIFMVNEGRKRGDEPVVERGWRMVQHNVDRIATQSLDILSFAKQRTPQLRRVDLEAAFRDAVEGVLPRATAQGVAVESSVGPGAASVVADPNLLAQVVTILLDNAVDACREDPPSGTAHKVRIASSRDGEWIRIEVADDGGGIDEENRERIFEDFFSTKGSMGTGLGLVVARKIVAEHGGTIDFAAQPGGGTVFTVRLPEPRGGTDPVDGGPRIAGLG